MIEVETKEKINLIQKVKIIKKLTSMFSKIIKRIKIFIHQLGKYLLINMLNCFPLSSKFLYWSKDAAEGLNKTITFF